MLKEELFALPIFDKFLIYAPINQFSALVDKTGMDEISAGLKFGREYSHPSVQPIIDWLLEKPSMMPTIKTGPITSSIFLGLIPTRDCNLGCMYCDFPPKIKNQSMNLDLARDAVDAYFELISKSVDKHCEIHFFGGEPFFAMEVVHFVVEYARYRAAQLELQLHLEATTNGFYPAAQCQWIADNFNTIVLSLDGTAEFHDLQRPTKNLRPTFEVVYENARIFSKSQAEFCIRICVTSAMVTALPKIAEWICTELFPAAVCFETLTLSPQAQAAELMPPDPSDFAKYFFTAERILDDYGIQTVNSTTSIEKNQISCCPVGKDALIVSPDGTIDACYLLKASWISKGLNMQLGRFELSENKYKMHLNQNSVQRVRSLNVNNKTLCSNCFCRFHCAGGCHVNHNCDITAGKYDDLCIQTRLITLTKLLKELGQVELASNLLDSKPALEKFVLQTSDLLL